MRASPSFPGRRWRAAISPAPASARTPRPCAAAPTRSASRSGWAREQDEAIRARVVETARDLGTKPAIVALAWVLSKPYVTAPIIGASKPHHIDDALAALALKLDAKTIARLEEPYRPKAVTGHV